MGRGKAMRKFYQTNLGNRKKIKRTRVTLTVGGKKYWESTGKAHLMREHFTGGVGSLIHLQRRFRAKKAAAAAPPQAAAPRRSTRIRKPK